jgi:hypothetical protein
LVGELGRVGPDDIRSALRTCAGHESVTLRGPGPAIAASLDDEGLSWTAVDWRAFGESVRRR